MLTDTTLKSTTLLWLNVSNSKCILQYIAVVLPGYPHIHPLIPARAINLCICMCGSVFFRKFFLEIWIENWKTIVFGTRIKIFYQFPDLWSKITASESRRHGQMCHWCFPKAFMWVLHRLHVVALSVSHPCLCKVFSASSLEWSSLSVKLQVSVFFTLLYDRLAFTLSVR